MEQPSEGGCFDTDNLILIARRMKGYLLFKAISFCAPCYLRSGSGWRKTSQMLVSRARGYSRPGIKYIENTAGMGYSIQEIQQAWDTVYRGYSRPGMQYTEDTAGQQVWDTIYRGYSRPGI